MAALNKFAVVRFGGQEWRILDDISGFKILGEFPSARFMTLWSPRSRAIRQKSFPLAGGITLDDLLKTQREEMVSMQLWIRVCREVCLVSFSRQDQTLNSE